VPRVNATAGNPVDNPVYNFVDNSAPPVETGPIRRDGPVEDTPGAPAHGALTWENGPPPGVDEKFFTGSGRGGSVR